MTDTCPIWGSDFPAETQRSARDIVTRVSNSPRAGGSFKIHDDEKRAVSYLPDDAKARLTTWIVDQNSQEAWMPEITREIVEYAKRRQPLPVYERANRLLRWVASKTDYVGNQVVVSEESLASYACSESISWDEMDYLMRYLESQGWATLNYPYGIDQAARGAIVTVDGHRQVEAQATNALSSQAFVAMWFDDSMKEVRVKGIILGIEDAGYKPYVVDEDEHIGKIDDKIIAEIRRSRFIVADFTHGEKGARGGVYFEAGFGLGLGIPVIYTCHKGQMSDVHFDTQHYNHILWEKPEELREALANRIRAVLGQGPEPLPSP